MLRVVVGKFRREQLRRLGVHGACDMCKDDALLARLALGKLLVLRLSLLECFAIVAKLMHQRLLLCEQQQEGQQNSQ